MQASEQQAILTIAMLTALADGNKADAERQAIRDLASSLAGSAPGIDLPKLVQDVILKRAKLADAVTALSSPEHKLLAYEMAVCVADADGSQSASEKKFLAELKAALGLQDSPQAQAVEQQADAFAQFLDDPVKTPAAAPAPAASSLGAGPVLATAAVAGAGALAGAMISVPAPAALPVAAAPVGGAGPVVRVQPSVSEAELDKSILNYSILCGALELLPQSWASMAIIPMQMKMVYAVGKVHGVELDKGHVKEFLATAGVGLAGQYVEQFGRKLLGGLVGKYVGRTAGKIVGAGTGIAMSFATTYALGQLAKRYYGGGRQMNTAVLKDTFDSLLGPAKKLQAEYMPQIQQKSRTLDAGSIMRMVQGK
ncbi:TerB family tellurite resistance protein [Piscinibacterium candidicorallinum]|uniref:TerB family tellurite resistance protein n=1 Tax=Piscinibacterium candidicorallinum TaxID=1793872 RepID=A0ABV7GZ34_9BURK